MIRSPMKRTPFRKRRPRAGAPRVKGRPSVSASAWRAIVADLIAQCRSRCEIPWCRNLAALQPHHVKPCSLGGEDSPDNTLMVCDACHKRFDWPFSKGRHVAEALGGESYEIALEYRLTKRAPLLHGVREFYERPDGMF